MIRYRKIGIILLLITLFFAAIFALQIPLDDSSIKNSVSEEDAEKITAIGEEAKEVMDKPLIHQDATDIKSKSELLDAASKVEYTSGESPFTHFENWEANEENSNFVKWKYIRESLEFYGIYEDIRNAVLDEDSIDLDLDIEEKTGYYFVEAEISGFKIGEMPVALLSMRIYGHTYVYVMFSKKDEGWVADGFAHIRERFEPEYRLEKSDDNSKYWLVLKTEVNHGTGLSLFDEVWFEPDGSVAAQYPMYGWSLFLKPFMNETWGEYSITAYYDGKSTITVEYLIELNYAHELNYNNASQVKINEYWDYDLESKQFKYLSTVPEQPEGFEDMPMEISPDYGMMTRYIKFYNDRLGDKEILSVKDWEELLGIE